MQSTDISPLGVFAARLAMLVPLGGEELAALRGLGGSIIQVAAGVDLVVPGAQARHVHFVVEGMIGRFAQFSDGMRQITALHIPGDVADLHAAVRPSAAPALQALVTTTLVRVPLEEMRQLVGRLPSIAEAFWAYCAVDVAVLERWAANLGRRTAAQRLAHLLCELSLRIEQSGRGDRQRFTLPLTQPQLGDALGLTPVHVNRTLKALRSDGLISINGRDFHVNDWERLVGLGDFEASYLLLEGPLTIAA